MGCPDRILYFVLTLIILKTRFGEVFEGCPEELKFEFNFANWDLNHWFDGMGAFEGEFHRYTFDMVFKYEWPNLG